MNFQASAGSEYSFICQMDGRLYVLLTIHLAISIYFSAHFGWREVAILGSRDIVIPHFAFSHSFTTD